MDSVHRFNKLGEGSGLRGPEAETVLSKGWKGGGCRRPNLGWCRPQDSGVPRRLCPHMLSSQWPSGYPSVR